MNEDDENYTYLDRIDEIDFSHSQIEPPFTN